MVGDQIRTPLINRSILPEEEHEICSVITFGLMGISGRVSDFSSALRLFAFAESQLDIAIDKKPTNLEVLDLMSKWKRIAVRDGAMSIYHFGQIMNGIKTKALPLAPTLNAAMNRALLAEARNRFRDNFRGYVRIRHAIAHAGDLIDSPGSLERNSVNTGIELDSGIIIGAGAGPTSRIFVGEIIDGNRLTVTHEEAYFSYELSDENLNHLKATCLSFFRAFPAFAD